jgi:hypothetical protein
MLVGAGTVSIDDCCLKSTTESFNIKTTSGGMAKSQLAINNTAIQLQDDFTIESGGVNIGTRSFTVDSVQQDTKRTCFGQVMKVINTGLDTKLGFTGTSDTQTAVGYHESIMSNTKIATNLDNAITGISVDDAGIYRIDVNTNFTSPTYTGNLDIYVMSKGTTSATSTVITGRSIVCTVNNMYYSTSIYCELSVDDKISLGFKMTDTHTSNDFLNIHSLSMCVERIKSSEHQPQRPLLLTMTANTTADLQDPSVTASSELGANTSGFRLFDNITTTNWHSSAWVTDNTGYITDLDGVTDSQQDPNDAAEFIDVPYAHGEYAPNGTAQLILTGATVPPGEWVKIDLRGEFYISGYYMDPRTEQATPAVQNQGQPKEWELWGSADNVVWFKLDDRHLASTSTGIVDVWRESRYYPLVTPRSVQYIAIVVTRIFISVFASGTQNAGYTSFGGLRFV